MFTVRRSAVPGIAHQPDVYLMAATPREAATRSQLVTPGAQLVVTGAGITVRFHVDAVGRLREVSRYTS